MLSFHFVLLMQHVPIKYLAVLQSWSCGEYHRSTCSTVIITLSGRRYLLILCLPLLSGKSLVAFVIPIITVRSGIHQAIGLSICVPVGFVRGILIKFREAQSAPCPFCLLSSVYSQLYSSWSYSWSSCNVWTGEVEKSLSCPHYLINFIIMRLAWNQHDFLFSC